MIKYYFNYLFAKPNSKMLIILLVTLTNKEPVESIWLPKISAINGIYEEAI